jgi:hypothetical protein
MWCITGRDCGLLLLYKFVLARLVAAFGNAHYVPLIFLPLVLYVRY